MNDRVATIVFQRCIAHQSARDSPGFSDRQSGTATISLGGVFSEHEDALGVGSGRRRACQQHVGIDEATIGLPSGRVFEMVSGPCDILFPGPFQGDPLPGLHAPRSAP